MSNHIQINELAQVINSEYEAAQLDAQSAVQHAINCGTALIEAKAQCKHGEWLSWLEANVKFTRMTATTYMKLAEANVKRALHLEDASSVREALKLLDAPTQPESAGDGKPVKPKAAQKATHYTETQLDEVTELLRQGKGEAEIAKEIGATRFQVRNRMANIAKVKAKEEAEALPAQCEEAKQELSLTAQQKLDKAIALFEQAKLAEMQKEFQVELQAAIQREQDKINEARKELIELEKKISKAATTITTIITYDEFKMIRGCLHPDRQPDELKEKFGKAFDLFNRLEQHVNIKAPIDFLRRYGWEQKSPFNKGRKQA